MKKKLNRIFLTSLLSIFILGINSGVVSAQVASETNNEAAIEITEDWVPKEPEKPKLPDTGKPTTPKKSGILPQTGEEKVMFATIIGLGLILIVVSRKLIKQQD